MKFQKPKTTLHKSNKTLLLYRQTRNIAIYNTQDAHCSNSNIMNEWMKCTLLYKAIGLKYAFSIIYIGKLNKHSSSSFSYCLYIDTHTFECTYKTDSMIWEEETLKKKQKKENPFRDQYFFSFSYENRIDIHYWLYSMVLHLFYVSTYFLRHNLNNKKKIKSF